MSRCQYCRCEIPGLATLCDECFEKGCDRIAHPMPWWQRFRLTYNSLCVFLFVFIYVYITTAFNRDNHPTMVGLVVLALILAAGLILIAFAFRDSHKPRVAHRGLYSFLILFLYFFFPLAGFFIPSASKPEVVGVRGCNDRRDCRKLQSRCGAKFRITK
jgi:hypothetical protein